MGEELGVCVYVEGGEVICSCRGWYGGHRVAAREKARVPHEGQQVLGMQACSGNALALAIPIEPPPPTPGLPAAFQSEMDAYCMMVTVGSYCIVEVSWRSTTLPSLPGPGQEKATS